MRPRGPIQFATGAEQALDFEVGGDAAAECGLKPLESGGLDDAVGLLRQAFRIRAGFIAVARLVSVRRMWHGVRFCRLERRGAKAHSEGIPSVLVGHPFRQARVRGWRQLLQIGH